MSTLIITCLVAAGIIGHTILLTTHLSLQRQIDALSRRLRMIESIAFAEPTDADENVEP